MIQTIPLDVTFTGVADQDYRGSFIRDFLLFDPERALGIDRHIHALRIEFP
jgi:hypothetical protein